MPDDGGVPGAGQSPPIAQGAERRRPGFLPRHWKLIILGVVVLVPAATFTVWSATTLAYSYSAGDRVGYVQKLSHKGWLCKTWEGELQMAPVPGSAPVLFSFTVRSDSLARVIEDAAGKQVALQYEQHRGVPTSCFGDTEYFIVGVRVLGAR